MSTWRRMLQLEESKLARYLQHPVRAASPDEVAEVMGTDVGSIGPVGASARVVTDEALSPRGPAGSMGTWLGRTRTISISAESFLGRIGRRSLQICMKCRRVRDVRIAVLRCILSK